MTERVGIGVASQSRAVGNRHAAEDERTSLHQAVRVVADADPHAHPPRRRSPSSSFASAARANSRSAGVVILKLRGSPATSRTTCPACSASAASSVPLPPCAPNARAAASTSRVKACGVCASHTRSRGMVVANPGPPSSAVRQLHRVARRQRRDGCAAFDGSIDRAIDRGAVDERARRIVNHDHVGGGSMASNALATESCRRAPPATKRTRGPRPARNEGSGVENVGRQRHDDVRHARM